MVLRKISIDNSVRYVLKSEQTKEIKQNSTKKIKFTEKVNQTKNFQKIIKKFVKDFTAGGFGILK